MDGQTDRWTERLKNEKKEQRITKLHSNYKHRPWNTGKVSSLNPCWENTFKCATYNKKSIILILMSLHVSTQVTCQSS